MNGGGGNAGRGTGGGSSVNPGDAGAAGDGDAGAPPMDMNDGTAVVGKARFTVITPTLIRMEYDDASKFVDTPSYFAVGRDARYRRAVITSDANGASIDTGTLRLTYTSDGKSFSKSNLQAQVKLAGTWTPFDPTGPNQANLGGTTATLDGWTGARQLDDGILSKAGWYVLDDSAGFLLANDWIQARTSKETDKYLFGYGLDYKAALASLTTIGGAVPLPRSYVMGAWYSRYWPYSADDFETIVGEYNSHDFPLDTVVLDMDWHEDGWTGWSWNRPLIPDPAKLFTFFHGQKLVSTLNIHPADGVAPHEDAYADFMNALGQDPKSGATVPFDAANQKYMAALYSKVHGPLADVGADFWWLDWQQDEFTRGLPGLRNLPWLNEQYFRYTSQDKLRGISFSRWGGPGDHRHPIHFSGDAYTSFEMLAFEVPFTATSGNSGLFFWTHDIGGHRGPRDEESYTRWCQFGALSAALRSHSSRDATLDRRPWTYPDWALASMKISFQLRSRLFPYIYSSAHQSAENSVPLLRTSYLEHADVDDAYKQPQQYFFGDELLVAPIVEAGVGDQRLGRQAVWFPGGTYYNFFTGEQFTGPSEHLVSSTINELPLFVKAGVPLPMQAFTPRMATTPPAELVVRCYPGEDGQSSNFTYYEDDGISKQYLTGVAATTLLTCSRQGDTVTVKVAPTVGDFDGQLAQRSFSIEIPATQSATAVTVDGAASKANVYTAADSTNRVHVDGRSIRAGVSVSVTAKAADAATLRKTAFAARAGLASSTGALADLVKTAWTNAGSNDQKWAVLAAAGAGAFPKRESLYGYPETPTTRVYQEAWSPLQSTMTTAWNSVQQMQTTSVTFGGLTQNYANLVQIDLTHPGTDLASSATATFSSQETDQTTGIADGKIGGYPDDRSQEWSTSGEKTGAWVTLTWSKPQTLAQIVLFDRINPDDQITAGTLSFSDGSSVAVDTVPNTPDLGGKIVNFAARSVTSVKFTVTGVSATTSNIGLAELAAYAQ